MPIGGGALLTSASRTSDLGNIFLRNSDSDSRIVALSSAPLTAPGENYGSVMLAVELTLEDTKSGKRRTVHAAVKMVPRNKLIQKLFIPEITFPKEIEMYRTVIPTFQRMQRKYGVKLVSDFVPKYFGSRIGLNSNKFDLNAILMLENLKKAGFVHVDRTLGCDFDTARLVLRQLANLHALGVAVKLKEREMFFNQILPIIKPIIPFYGFDLEKTQSQLMNIVREDPECEEYLERYWKTVGQSKYGTTEEGASREPWATIAHCDFWISNVMVKLEANKAIDCKIFDFQFVTYDSPGRDLAVFIFTSVQNAVIRDRFDELIDEYLSEFLAVLRSFQVDTRAFTKESLMAELKASIRERGLLHSCYLLRLIFASNENSKPVEDLDMDDFMKEEETLLPYKEKLCLIVKEVGKRQWL